MKWVYWSWCEVPVIVVRLWGNLNFLGSCFWKIFKYRISWKSVQWEPSCSVRTDGRTDMPKIMVAFRTFAKAHNDIVQKQYFCHPTCGYILPLFWTSWRIQSKGIISALSNLKSEIFCSSLFMFCLPSRASGHGMDTSVTSGEGKCSNENRKCTFI